MGPGAVQAGAGCPGKWDQALDGGAPSVQWVSELMLGLVKTIVVDIALLRRSLPGTKSARPWPYYYVCSIYCIGDLT